MCVFTADSPVVATPKFPGSRLSLESQPAYWWFQPIPKILTDWDCHFRYGIIQIYVYIYIYIHMM